MLEAKITIFEDNREQWSSVIPLPAELGRQKPDEPSAFQVLDLGTHYRVTIASSDVREVSRTAIRLDFDQNGGLVVRNVHPRLTFLIGDPTGPLPPGHEYSVKTPTTVVITRSCSVRMEPVNTLRKPADSAVESFAGDSLRTMQWIPPGSEDDQPADLGNLLRSDEDDQRGRLAVTMVKKALEVVQKAAGSDEFFQAAIESTAKMVDLDHAYVLLRSDNHWTLRSTYSRKNNESWKHEDGNDTEGIPEGSGRLLDRLMLDKQTVIFEPENYLSSIGSSLMLLGRAVAAPMFDYDHNVIGALYGDRRLGSDSPDAPIGDLEAALIEVMAAAVASGIARQKEEAGRRREADLRSSMNQFFSPEVLASLQADEGLLSGRDAEVTVLFCDIRGFSAVSERVGPQRTIEWINDILTELSECVLATDGVLVDYIGDELMAMWGAPADQPHHAELACQAALAMLQKVEPLRQRWSDITPERFGIGIGINTGNARVGNTGSRVKFKYGPLGNTVNIASRVQGMTKQFGVTALVTQSTLEAVQASRDTSVITFRQIADVRPVGVQSHLRIHQLAHQSTPAWNDLKDRYEEALQNFHDNNLTRAARVLVSLMDTHPEDTPSTMLLQRVVDAIVRGEQSVDAVLQLVNK
ncbi:adenylate/guanylate cyclase domain-containing protein [Neorhodopirellula pilleata]|uniref:Adenylate cyclase 1 n=1 Tax=Neorhodopirellula pilleata TaxID=2714738 RepID=A0A5C5ZY94_9BACT|nr:adenylate/guanylate cyclase domain-containing protein [Neorhodopirellula pilleata]TWT91897.1 Adenylate cyclase 1 [Neorhodopirellula pilleata]